MHNTRYCIKISIINNPLQYFVFRVMEVLVFADIFLYPSCQIIVVFQILPCYNAFIDISPIHFYYHSLYESVNSFTQRRTSMLQSTNMNPDTSSATATNINEWHSATGPLAIPMTNDYLFRALLQRNNHVLKGLICSLLHLSPKQIHSAVITNPIILGNQSTIKLSFWTSPSH